MLLTNNLVNTQPQLTNIILSNSDVEKLKTINKLNLKEMKKKTI